MIEKERAISILEEIETSLKSDNWKEDTLHTINLYIKGLKVATNKKIKKMIDVHIRYIEKYGEDDMKTIKLGKKIDKEIQKIYNKKS